MPPPDALAKLAALAEHRHRNPKVSLQEATALLQVADDPHLKAAALQVIGLAHHELGHLAEASACYRESIATSLELGLSDLEATSRAHLAMTLLALGDFANSERELAEARARSSPSSRGVVAARHAVLLHRTGRLAEAVLGYQRALRWLEDNGDEAPLALVHLNRGILFAYQGNHDAALESLSTAEAIARRRDLPVLVAMATHNLGFALGRLGKLPDALAAFARAEKAYAALGDPNRLVPVLEADRCEVLLLAGLVAEAQSAASRAVAALVAAGDLAHLNEGRLLLARALLAGGDYQGAATEAERAARAFSITSRLPWAALARYVAIQAEILENQDKATPPAGLLRRCRRIARDLDAQGWPVESVHVHTFAGRLALSQGRPAVARAELSQAVAARTRGTADLRAQAWHAAALLRLADGNRGGAKRALHRGMAVVDDYRASLGATELRARAASHGADLARLGTRLALEERRAVDVLRWAERSRAGALQRPAVRPPDDERLAADLTDLRTAQSELRAAALDAGATAARAPVGVGDAASGAIASLRARIQELERSVRDQTRQARDDTVATGRVDVAAIRAALGPTWLVEYVSIESHMYAITVTRRRVRLHNLGAAPIADEKRYLLFTLRRLLRSPSGNGVVQALASTASRLDDMLIAPLGLPASAPLVVVPTGVLHGLPWSALPSLAQRPTTVAPSAAHWLSNPARTAIGFDARAKGHASGPDSGPNAGPAVALVAGPQLPGADDEVRQIAALYPESEALVGPAATAAAAMSALERCDVAHLAAHGRFRADSPLFSSVLLADGPITVYDLERLRAVPRVVVLAACDAAVSAVEAGDELLGTAVALIGLGVRTVVAPVMPVPDGSTAPFMVALHQRLAAGDIAEQALVAARAGQDPAVAAAFICISCSNAAAQALTV